MHPEQHGHERQSVISRRFKAGLETPLVGRFYGEGKLLVFAPPPWYDSLVGICVFGGAAASLYCFLTSPGDWQLFTSVAVFLAGLWAAASNERMVCDLKKRTYARFEGASFATRLVRGSFTDLDALVLTSQPYAHGTGFSASILYRLELHWKDRRHPVLVAEIEIHSIPFNAPINTKAGPILARGAAFAHALSIPYYDNSHLMGKAPVPVL